MISVFVETNREKEVVDIIRSVERLDELVNINPQLDMVIQEDHIINIENGIIRNTLDWLNAGPPLLFPSDIPLSKDNLLSLIFLSLGNFEMTFQYTSNPNVLSFSKNYVSLLQGDEGEVSDGDNYTAFHNNAICKYYSPSFQQSDIADIDLLFTSALSKSDFPDDKAFTTLQYASFLLDTGRNVEAEERIQRALSLSLSDNSKIELQSLLSKIWMEKLVIPYDQELMEKLKSSLWETLTYYEQHDRNAEAAMVLMDATHIANISESFSEALGYVTKAINIFKEEGLSELYANALMRKGVLLYTWAQKDSPQFYKPAIDAYQDALKIFTKQAAPHLFANIHHQLALIYTDMPAEQKKKSIWAGIAVSSYTEALQYYNKEDFPYEYGMICNNYGNSFTKFPKAALTDNFEKALFYYQEALDVRPPSLNYERTITLLNYLEASWNVGNDPDSFNQSRYDDMINKALEIKTLIQDESLLAEAQKHIDLLEKLKATV